MLLLRVNAATVKFRKFGIVPVSSLIIGLLCFIIAFSRSSNSVSPIYFTLMDLYDIIHKYTEHQKKLITSSERQSLNPKH